MASPDFPNAPEMSDAFREQQPPPEPDAAQQIPNNPDRQDLDELNYVPPQPVHDPNRVMAPTPFGTIEIDVQQELDAETQQAIRDAQQQERTTEDDFRDLRSVDEVPGAGEEYQRYLDEPEPDRDDFDERMTDRFNQWREHEQDLDR